MNILTIESRNTQESLNNSSWITNINKDIIIENGDAIVMKNCYLNIDQNSNSNINILEDTVINLEFAFYVINGIQNIYNSYNGDVQNPMKYMYTPTFFYNSVPSSSPYQPLSNYLNSANENYYENTDFQPYVLHNSDTYELITDNISFTIFKGSYSPTEIANLITIHMNGINNKNLQNVVFDTNVGPNTGSKLVRVINSDSEVFIGDSYTKGQTNMLQIKQIKLIDNHINIPAMPVGTWYLIGANQFALDFNTDSQKFQFSFMHSPLYDNKGNISTFIGQTFWAGVTLVNGETDKTVFGPLSQQTKASGIFFTKLEPKSFWVDKLGFDMGEMICDVENGISIPEIMSKTTDNSQPLNALQMSLAIKDYSGWPYINTDNTTGSGAVPCIYSFLASSDIIPKTSRNQYQTSNSGYYYIFSDLMFKNELMREGKPNEIDSVNQISGVVSKFFLNSDYITGFQDSSIVYEHSGEPYNLSKINVNIYDANMNSALLKKNSVIFFQIYKNNNGQQIPTSKNPMVK